MLCMHLQCFQPKNSQRFLSQNSCLIFLSYVVQLEKYKRPIKISTRKLLNHQHEIHYIRTIPISASGVLIFGVQAMKLQPQGSCKSRFFYAGFYCFMDITVMKIVLITKVCSLKSMQLTVMMLARLLMIFQLTNSS